MRIDLIREIMIADQEYIEKVNSSADLFVPGTVTDVVMRSLGT